jgi:glutathione-regulated potassium-efflux system ancillary protein KefC
VATAFSEIMVGTVAQLIIGAPIGTTLLHTDDSWTKFLSGTGAIVLTFVAGAELDPAVLRTKWKEACLIGFVGFVAAFFGCAALAYWGLHWDVRPSWLAGVAMSTASVAVIYAVMLEFGLNVTSYARRY